MFWSYPTNLNQKNKNSGAQHAGSAILRPFQAADQAAARRLILAGLGEHFGFVDDTCNPDVDDIYRHYVAPGHAFLVAELEHRLVGTAALVHDGPDTGRIVRVSVGREHRRSGIARRLVGQLIQTARSWRLNRLLVETNHDWEDALAFYRALGFAEYARDSESAYLALDL